MRDTWFWRAVAVVALMAALGYVASRFVSPPPVQAQAGSIIAVTAAEQAVHRLFLVDTSRNVILVYGGATNAFSFTLLAGRYFDVDAKATVGREFPFRQRGYKITEMQRHAEETRPRGGRRGGR